MAAAIFCVPRMETARRSARASRWRGAGRASGKRGLWRLPKLWRDVLSGRSPSPSSDVRSATPPKRCPCSHAGACCGRAAATATTERSSAPRCCDRKRRFRLSRLSGRGSQIPHGRGGHGAPYRLHVPAPRAASSSSLSLEFWHRPTSTQKQIWLPWRAKEFSSTPPAIFYRSRRPSTYARRRATTSRSVSFGTIRGLMETLGHFQVELLRLGGLGCFRGALRVPRFSPVIAGFRAFAGPRIIGAHTGSL